MIKSRTNEWIQHLIKLKDDKRYRGEQGLLVISGIKLVREVSAVYRLKTLILQEAAAIPEGVLFDQVQFVTPALLKQITGLQHPEPVAAEVAAPDSHPMTLETVSRLLVLDRVSDPGNLGTLLRTALALGWGGVFMTAGCVDLFNDKALRASKGAPFFLPFQIGSEDELSALLKKRAGRCFVADAKGRPIDALEISGMLTLIMGNESHGVSERLKGHFEWVSIPLHPQMESLNVSIAGAILMDQMRRGSL